MCYKWLVKSLFVLFVAVVAAAVVPCAEAQTGLYVPAKGPVRNMQKALHNPEVFYLLLCYDGSAPTYSVSDLDLLDSAYRIAFDIDNPMYYTMAVESYGNANEALGKERVDGVYRYFAMRGGQPFPVRTAHNPIHCSCQGDTVETLRFEVPTTTAVYNAAELPESRRMLNKSIPLQNCVLVTFRNNPPEVIGTGNGCYLPASDTTIRSYYASLAMPKGAVYSVTGTKDTCPDPLEIKIEEHLDYKELVERYFLIPHRKYILLQLGYIVLHSNFNRAIGECAAPLPDSIMVRFPITADQWAGKIRIFGKKLNNKGVPEYKALTTKKLKSKDKVNITIQAGINAAMLDTIYLGKRIQPDEISTYFYPAISEVEEGSFSFGGRHYKAFKVDKHGTYQIKPALRALLRIIEADDEEEVDQPVPTPRKPKKGEDESLD